MRKKKGGRQRRIRIPPRKCRWPSCVNVGVWPGGICYNCRKKWYEFWKHFHSSP